MLKVKSKVKTVNDNDNRYSRLYISPGFDYMDKFLKGTSQSDNITRRVPLHYLNERFKHRTEGVNITPWYYFVIVYWFIDTV